jgi:putative ABC transport system permease protein
MVATVVFGVASVALAVGLAGTLGLIETARTHDTAPVSVGQFGAGGLLGPGGQLVGPGESSAGQTTGPGTGPGGQPGQGRVRKQVDPLATGGPSAATVEAVIAAQPGTKASYGMVEAPATIAGVTGEVDVVGYSADPRWAGFEMTEGRWFTAPGEAVAPTPLLTAAGAKIGDTDTATVDGHRVPLRIVGEVFSTRNQGMQLFTDLSTLTAAMPEVTPFEYRVAVAPGVDLDAYVKKLDTALQPLGMGAMRNPAGHSDVLLALNTLTLFLTMMLVAVAALGILNAVVLQTRERVRELGVHKAIGMTPRQAVTVVLSSVVLVGVVGGVAGVPAGVALHRVLMPAMGASAGIRLPRALLEVYHPWLLLLLAAGGLVIAVVGALLPAGWAARLRTATALRTE